MEDIVLKNFTGAPGYVLPETGGPGTTWFTTGGLALTGLMYKDKKRKGSMKQMKTKRKWLAVLLTVIMTLMLAAYWGAFLLFFPLSLYILPFTNFWLPMVIAYLMIYPALEKSFNIESTIKKMREEQLDAANEEDSRM